MFQGFLTEGLVSTGAGIGAVLIDAQPLVVAILSRFLFGELIGLWGWLGLSLGLVGISFCGLPSQWISSLFIGDINFLQNQFSAFSGFVYVFRDNYGSLRASTHRCNCSNGLAYGLGWNSFIHYVCLGRI